VGSHSILITMVIHFHCLQTDSESCLCCGGWHSTHWFLFPLQCIFNVIKSIWHEVYYFNHFQTYNLMALIIFIVLCFIFIYIYIYIFYFLFYIIYIYKIYINLNYKLNNYKL
jgi:hypothetical protein